MLRWPTAANYYDLLGVDVDASEEDIRAAYRRKAKQLHPDVNKEVTAVSSKGPGEACLIGGAEVQEQQRKQQLECQAA